MPRPIPFPTKPVKQTPSDMEFVSENLTETEIKQEKPNETPTVETTLTSSPINQEKPTESPPNETILEVSPDKQEMPSDYIEENCVIIDGKKIEIKPTKVAYFRNKTAATYNVMKNVPLTEIFEVKKGILDENRDGDQIVYDFLVAALDDKELVRDKYNNLDADQIDRIVKIFGRINHIDEKYEAQRKNREAQGSR